MGMPISLTPRLPPEQVAMVNQSFREEFFPVGDAMGKQIRRMGFDMKPRVYDDRRLRASAVSSA
jgi:hypothetical protein